MSAPYGIYKTKDGYLALAMMDIKVLAEAIDCCGLENYTAEQAFAERDSIKLLLAEHLLTQETKHWLKALQEKDLWAMEVLDWEKMMQQEAYKVLEMEQVIYSGKEKIFTTRCPIRINGEKLYADRPAPQLGEHNEAIKKAFSITP
ncbi:MAG: hypothetical protein EOP49_51620 [Sphingobacteriales bacterium]|nr:MAG: hypothetical protein EOP49_51620 [Sphingobacteriales bacterium]